MTRTRDGNGLYSHILNPYCAESIYFISDREQENKELAKASASPVKGNDIATALQPGLLHERDIQAPSQEGRLLLGEDFRSEKSQRFTFTLRALSPTMPPCVMWHSVQNDQRLLIFADKCQWRETSGDFHRQDRRMFKPNSSKQPSTSKTHSHRQMKNFTVGIDYSYSGALFTSTS